MPRPRPRRALRPSVAVRVARVAVPLALVGLGDGRRRRLRRCPGPAPRPPCRHPASSAPSASAPCASSPSAATSPGRPAPPRARPRLAPEPHATPPTTPPAEKAAPTRRPEPTADQLAESGQGVADDVGDRRPEHPADPEAKSDVVTEVKAGAEAGRDHDGPRRLPARRLQGRGPLGHREVRLEGQARPRRDAGVTDAPCSKGSGMESGLTPDAVLVHRTVCARFPPGDLVRRPARRRRDSTRPARRWTA